MCIQSRQQIVHLVVELDAVVKQTVVDGVRAADQKVVNGILITDAAIGLCCQGILCRTCYAGKTADEVTIDNAWTGKWVAVVDVLHDDLVTG